MLVANLCKPNYQSSHLNWQDSISYSFMMYDVFLHSSIKERLNFITWRPLIVTLTILKQQFFCNVVKHKIGYTVVP